LTNLCRDRCAYCTFAREASDKSAHTMTPDEVLAVAPDPNWELVFYWYQSRCRVIAGEYAGKFWMMADAISRNRTDGSLVRLITPTNDPRSLYVSARCRVVFKNEAALWTRITTFLRGSLIRQYAV
jgi:hypothetical protein